MPHDCVAHTPRPQVAMHATRLAEEIEELTGKLETIVEGINDAAQEISGDLGDLLDEEP